MNKSFAAEFLKECKDEVFPVDLLAHFEPLECMAKNTYCETFLLTEKSSGRLFVAKCYHKDIKEKVNSEAEILPGLQHDGLPKFKGKYETEESIYILCEYANGITLDEFIEDKLLSENQIIEIGTKLCDILSYLHTQNPPIIHRDIKPSNVIIDPENGNKITIIDFGISRIYDKTAKTDTVFFGTQEFSPPEQYGFSQTDCRADIFSLGVLLCWLLTGEAEIKRALSNIQNKRLAGILKKCTSFAPNDRYASAEAVKKALLRACPEVQKRNRILSLTAGVLVVVLCITGGIWLHIYNSREIFTADHIPAYITSQDLISESVKYLNEKYDTNLFSMSDEITNIGYIRKLLAEVFKYDEKYAYAMPPNDPPYPHESESNFFPWGFPENETIHRDVMTYTAVKIFWPDVVMDYSSLKDDDGVYPGVRVALIFSKKHHILNGVNRPDHLTLGDVAVILANADKESESMK